MKNDTPKYKMTYANASILYYLLVWRTATIFVSNILWCGPPPVF